MLAENFLCVGGSNDDIGDGRCNSDFDAGVSFLRKFALEELVQFGVEDTICDELSPLRAVNTHISFHSLRFLELSFSYIAAPGTLDAILTEVCVRLNLSEKVQSRCRSILVMDEFKIHDFQNMRLELCDCGILRSSNPVID